MPGDHSLFVAIARQGHPFAPFHTVVEEVWSPSPLPCFLHDPFIARWSKKHENKTISSSLPFQD